MSSMLAALRCPTRKADRRRGLELDVAEQHKAGSSTTVVKGKFVIEELAFTTSGGATVPGGENERYYPFGSLQAAYFDFEVGLWWTVSGDTGVDCSQGLRVYIERLDGSPEACAYSVELTVVNSSASRNLVLGDIDQINRLPDANGDTWHVLGRLNPAEAMDRSLGWLHDDALVVEVKMKVKTGEATDSTSPAGNEDAAPQSLLQWWSDSLRGLFAHSQLEPEGVANGRNCAGCHRLGPARQQGLMFRAGANTMECEAPFEIPNFAATCAMTRDRFDHRANSRVYTSPPIMRAGNFEFSIGVVWFADDDGLLDEGKGMGAFVRRVDSSPEPCTAMVEIVLLNVNSRRNFYSVDPGFMLWTRRLSRGWFGEDDEEGEVRFPLREILDPQQGWLHDKALRLRAKIEVVTGLERTAGLSGLTDDSVSETQEVCSNLCALLESGEMSDFLIVSAEQSWAVHTQILAGQSPVFKRMFQTDMLESREKQLKVNDDPRAVGSLIRYCYGGFLEPSLLDDDLLTIALLKVAHRFEVHGLQSRCVRTLASRLKIETVALMLEVADLLGLENFKAICLDFLKPRLGEVQNTETYKDLVQRRPRVLADIIAALKSPAGGDHPFPDE